MDDFDAIQNEVSAALVATVRSATSISKEDISFQCTLDPAVKLLLDEQRKILSSIARKLLRECSASNTASGLRFDNADSIDANWNQIVEVLDDLFEKADRCIDTFNGIVKYPESNHSYAASSNQRSTSSHHLFRNPRLSKPQLMFDIPPDNFASGPFQPLLKTKVHGLSPLRDSPSSEEGYPHPYEEEIKSYSYPLHVTKNCEPICYQPFDTTSARYVDDLDALRSMVEELKMAKEIAIDLEHHDTHSYIGIVSLMQISTRDKDWIIDTLKPWRRNLAILNEVFTDPSILKVLHGAQMDIIWLQRDFGLYIVGLFDTYHASRVLKYPGGSLSFLLKKFVGFEAQKQYQLADWRIRPLPPALLDYARSDTHFLLYIYDYMRNELAGCIGMALSENNRLEQVLERSKETSLQRYEHPYYNEVTGSGRGGWLSMIEKTPVSLSRVEFTVFRKLHQWRDTTARSMDESTGEIMPNHLLLNIAKNLPTDPATAMKLIQAPSTFVLSRLSEITNIVNRVLTSKETGPELMEVLSSSHRLSKPRAATYGDRPQSLATSAPCNNRTLEAPVVRTYDSLFWGQTLSVPTTLIGTPPFDYESAFEKRFRSKSTSLQGFANHPEHTFDASSPTHTYAETEKNDPEKCQALPEPGKASSMEPSGHASVSNSLEMGTYELNGLRERLSRRSKLSSYNAKPNLGTPTKRSFSMSNSSPTNFSTILEGLNEGHKRRRPNLESPLLMEEQVPRGNLRKVHQPPGKSFTFK